MVATDPYSWWRNAVALAEADPSWWRNPPPSCAITEEAHAGRYRATMYKDGPLVPVAIWWHQQVDADGEVTGDDKLVCRMGFDGEKLIEGDDLDKRWLFIAKRPVSEANYDAALKNKAWHDIDQAITRPQRQDKPHPLSERHGSPPPMGHNAPADEIESIRDQIETAKTNVDAYAKIEDDTTAARAQSLRSRLLELSREADKRREALKKPHLEAGKEIDDAWQPLKKDAKAAADTLARALGTYETAKANAARELLRRAEEAARKAEAAGKPAPQTPAPEPLPTQIKGGYGRAAPIKVVKIVTEITDHKALIAWAISVDQGTAIYGFALKMAQDAVNAGHQVPGVTVEEQRKVA